GFVVVLLALLAQYALLALIDRLLFDGKLLSVPASHATACFLSWLLLRHWWAHDASVVSYSSWLLTVAVALSPTVAFELISLLLHHRWQSPVLWQTAPPLTLLVCAFAALIVTRLARFAAGASVAILW